MFQSKSRCGGWWYYTLRYFSGVCSAYGITFGFDDGYNMGSYGGLFDSQNDVNLIFCWYMNHFNKIMELYFIYLISAETKMLGSEEVLVESLVKALVLGQEVMLVVLLKVLMVDKLEVKLVPGMLAVSVNMSKVYFIILSLKVQVGVLIEVLVLKLI